MHIDHGIPDFDRRYVYHVAAGSQGKIPQERGSFIMFTFIIIFVYILGMPWPIFGVVSQLSHPFLSSS